MAKTSSNIDSGDELPFEINFIEQAEYIDTEKFAELTIEHPEEEAVFAEERQFEEEQQSQEHESGQRQEPGPPKLQRNR